MSVSELRGATRGLETIGLNVDADDALRALQPGDLLRHKPDRAAAEDRDRLAALRLCPIDARVTSRQNVGEKEKLLVAEIALHLARAVVRIRHADKFRLAAVIAAVEFGVAEERAALLFHQPALGAIFLRIGIFAMARQIVLAEETAAARDWKRHDDAVAALKLRHSGARLPRPRP